MRPRQLQLLPAIQPQESFPVRMRPQLHHPARVHDRRPVDARETLRIKLFFEIAHRRAQHQRLALRRGAIGRTVGVDAHVIAGRIDPALAAKLFAVAALCHALPDALLFDLGRVHAYKARIEALPRTTTDDEAACLASIAALCAATLVGDLELVQRALTHIEQARWSAMPPLLADHVEEFRAFRDITFPLIRSMVEIL